MEEFFDENVMAIFYSTFKNLTNLFKSDIILSISCKEQNSLQVH